MPESYPILPEDHEKLGQILNKILTYQATLPDRRGVELDELESKQVLSKDDLEFLTTHSVKYKPRKISAYKRGQEVLRMDTGCGYVAFNLGGEPKKRRTPLRDFPPIVQRLLETGAPDDEMLLYVYFSEHNGLGIIGGVMAFIFRNDPWRERLPSIRAVACELGLNATHDRDLKDGDLGYSHTLMYALPKGAPVASAAVFALLNRGCGIADDKDVVYMAAALDDEEDL